MMKSFAALVAALAFAGPAAAASLVNGGFEQPGVAGYTQLAIGSTYLPGWTVVGLNATGDNYVQYTNSSAFGGLGVVASEGSNFLDLTGVVGRGKGVASNPIDTVAGAHYRVGFDVGAFYVGGSGPFGDSIVDLLIDDVKVGAFKNVLGLTSGGSDWQRFTYEFTAAGPTTKITLLSSTSLESNNLGVGLDNVTFEALRETPGVPEPAAWSLMILGFGLAGARMRRASGRSAAA